MSTLVSFSVLFFTTSILFGLAHAAGPSAGSLRASQGSYWVGAVTVLLLLVMEGLRQDSWVVTNFQQGMWLAVTFMSAIAFAVRRKATLGFGAAGLSIVCLALILMAELRSGAPLLEARETTVLLGSHTFFIFLCLGAYSFSFLFAGLYLMQDFLLRRKWIRGFTFELPPLEITGKLIFLFLTIGTASFCAGVVGGLVEWAHLETEGVFLLQPPILISFLVLASYLFIIALRRGPLERSRRMALASVVMYPILIFVFFVSHDLGMGGAS